MKYKSPKFKPGDLVVGVPWVNPPSGVKVTPMSGIILGESPRSNWWGDVYTRWYSILAENGKVVEELEVDIRGV